MTDDLTAIGAPGSSTSVGAPAADPSSPDERIKGFQRLVSAKDATIAETQRANAALQARLEALELGQMSESERAGVLTQREQARLSSLEAENERLKVFAKYPKVAPTYESLISAKTAEEQAVILNRLLNPTPGGSAAEPEISDVDMNNPMRTPDDAISLPPSSAMDGPTADRILAAWGDRPVRGR